MTLIDPNDVYTLILTNKPLLQSLFKLNTGDPELALWESRLAEFAAAVGGEIIWNVQSGTGDSEVETAYIAWQKDPGDPSKTNAAALALHDWIWEKKQALPHLRYIVLAGDDRILPHLRVSIVPMDGTADRVREPAYLGWLPSGAIAAGSPIASVRSPAILR